MNYTTAVFLINKNVRAVLCTFESDLSAKRELFKTLDTTIIKGDLVIVPTDTRHNFTVVKVVDTDVDVDFDSSVPVKWVASKLDVEPHKVTLAQEEQAIQTLKAAELRKKREDLAASLLANSRAELDALAISDSGKTAALPAE